MAVERSTRTLQTGGLPPRVAGMQTKHMSRSHPLRALARRITSGPCGAQLYIIMPIGHHFRHIPASAVNLLDNGLYALLTHPFHLAVHPADDIRDEPAAAIAGTRQDTPVARSISRGTRLGAKTRELDVKDRGRIPADLIAQYHRHRRSSCRTACMPTNHSGSQPGAMALHSLDADAQGPAEA
jgi:hypothetical protein